MKRWSKALLFTAAAAAAAVLIGCEPVSGGGGSTVPAGPGVESVTVSQTAITLEVDSIYTLTASVLPAEMDTGVSWKSSDQSVVSVAKGVIKALKAGTADVTAMANADTSKTAVCKVTVVDKGEGTQPTNITLSKTVLNLGFGETALLSVNVSPDDAVMPVLTWSSSNDTVVKVADGQVTGIGEGTAIVTVSAGELRASCDVTVTRSGIEGDWQTGWNRYVITADTITTYGRDDTESDWIPRTRYVYSDKTGNEIFGTVTVTVQSMWDEDNNKWQTVDEEIAIQMDQIQKLLNQSLRECIRDMMDDSETTDKVKLESFIAGLRAAADEMDMTFNESNLTVENLDKPVPNDVKKLYTAYMEKMSVAYKEEMKKPCTYTYTVTDNEWDGTMIQFRGAYDTSKKWFEQTNGWFYTYTNGINISYYPESKELYMWNNGATATEKSVYFSSVTETSLIERDSGEEWTALWNGTVLTLTDPDGGSYKLEWSGDNLYR